MAQNYEFKSEKDTVSFTGRPDPRDVIKNEDSDQDDDREEDLAWSLAAAYAFLKEEQDEEV